MGELAMEKQDIMDSEERIEEFVTASEKMLAEVLSEVNQDQEELKSEGSNGEAKDGKVTVSEDSNNEETQTQVPPENMVMEETKINPEQEETKVKVVVKGSLGGEAPKPKVCTLDEEPENPTTEKNDLSNASWREDSINDDFDEDEEDYSDDDDEYYSDEDDEDEEVQQNGFEDIISVREDYQRLWLLFLPRSKLVWFQKQKKID